MNDAAALRDLAERAIQTLIDHKLSLAVAESLTGGMVMAELIAVPGASHAVHGGVVAYSTELKRSILNVDAEQLRAHGPVDPLVAEQMAYGVRHALLHDGAPCQVGISTTGVAGPGPSDGHPEGTVYLGVSIQGGGNHHELHHFHGDRASIRTQSVRAVLELLVRTL